MRLRRLVPLASALLLLGAVAATQAAGQQQQSFPHALHARLFPVCTGCHAGIPTGDRSTFYPDPSLCAACHDGVTQKRVQWTPPRPQTWNLRFTHPQHTAAAGGASAPQCTTCHEAEGASWMNVSGIVVSQCLACHAHQGSSHLIDAPCEKCHVPLAGSGFDLQRIKGLPVPEDHRASDFLAGLHGREASASPARCATCHVRQRCTSCHVNAATNPVIAKIPLAAADMKLPAYKAHYPTPASHRADDWLEVHGTHAGVTECSTCHTRNDCEACHRTKPPKVIATLPARVDVTAPGVHIERHAPPSHSAPSWPTSHAAAAGASPGTCATCHTQNYCESCHRAPMPSRARFHPQDFLSRHAAEAYGRKLECSNCHNVATFCRSCHEQLGMGTVGKLGPAFHNGQPQWLLRHGQAARQGLESCTACHKQQDCLQCHSALGAFHVNPHGPGFDPVRAEKKNAMICFACHVTDPLQEKNP